LVSKRAQVRLQFWNISIFDFRLLTNKIVPITDLRPITELRSSSTTSRRRRIGHTWGTTGWWIPAG
jgi:hypothetical protein